MRLIIGVGVEEEGEGWGRGGACFVFSLSHWPTDYGSLITLLMMMWNYSLLCHLNQVHLNPVVFIFVFFIFIWGGGVAGEINKFSFHRKGVKRNSLATVGARQKKP